MSLPVANFIVLADDDKDHAVLFQRILHQVDASKRLSVVHDGEELLHLLSEVRPEILFLDLKMPCKHGLECLQEIRLRPELDGLKVVVYSSSAHMSDIKNSYIHKADLYMVKPFSSDHLKSALETILTKDSWRDAFRNRQYYINNRFVPFTAQV